MKVLALLHLVSVLVSVIGAAESEPSDSELARMNTINLDEEPAKNDVPAIKEPKKLWPFGNRAQSEAGPPGLKPREKVRKWIQERYSTYSRGSSTLLPKVESAECVNDMEAWDWKGEKAISTEESDGVTLNDNYDCWQWELRSPRPSDEAANEGDECHKKADKEGDEFQKSDDEVFSSEESRLVELYEKGDVGSNIEFWTGRLASYGKTDPGIKDDILWLESVKDLNELIDPSKIPVLKRLVDIDDLSNLKDAIEQLRNGTFDQSDNDKDTITQMGNGAFDRSDNEKWFRKFWRYVMSRR